MIEDLYLVVSGNVLGDLRYDVVDLKARKLKALLGVKRKGSAITAIALGCDGRATLVGMRDGILLPLWATEVGMMPEEWLRVGVHKKEVTDLALVEMGEGVVGCASLSAQADEVSLGKMVVKKKKRSGKELLELDEVYWSRTEYYLGGRVSGTGLAFRRDGLLAVGLVDGRIVVLDAWENCILTYIEVSEREGRELIS